MRPTKKNRPSLANANKRLLRKVIVHKETEQALQDSEQKLKAVVYGSPIPIFVIDQERRVMHWNNALAEITGIKAADMVGSKRHWSAFYAEERPCMVDLLVDGQTERISKLYRGKYRKSKLVPDAYEATDFLPVLGKWLHFTAAVIKDSNGAVMGAVETLEDITERKQAEEAIRTLNEELEQKVRERTAQLLNAQEELVRNEKLAILGQLAGSVGHELRNPLGVISNAVYYLKTILPADDEKVREYLDIIKGEVDTSGRIISDLLDFSRTKTPQAHPVFLPAIIRQSIDHCIIPDNISVRIDLPESLPSVKVDSVQMDQVFQNLIVNAVQAMPKGGSLSISAKSIADCGLQISDSKKESKHSTFHIPHSAIEISVVDTGEGISPENLRRLFQPLFTTKTRGVGLGLVISKRNVEANNGRLMVASAMGKGTTFTITLPIEEEAA